MQLSDFDYHLPKEQIAQRPLEERDQSKLMMLDKSRQSVSRHHFFDLPDLLDPHSVLVLNESRVIPARLIFPLGNGKGEILLIKPLRDATWECMVRPGEKLQPKVSLSIGPQCTAHIKRITEKGLRVIEFECDDFHTYLAAHGHTPTPPYIKTKIDDPEKYQTVYAKKEGSVAAPTAGLHFTNRIFEGLKAKNIAVEKVTLHVGLGTFAPIKTERIEDHHIHSEWFELSADTADRLNTAKAEGKKIVAVGTTSVRVLEACADTSGTLHPTTGETDIFIYPGYEFKFIDQLITNFHVPKSSLLMLVSALAGREFILNAYELAKKEGYRFFSFGDAMFIQ